MLTVPVAFADVEKYESPRMILLNVDFVVFLIVPSELARHSEIWLNGYCKESWLSIAVLSLTERA